MTDAEREDYLKLHLDNELQWLLRAATEWHVQNEIQLQIDGYQVQVYAMDSAFLHARTLFEFFTKKTRDNYYGCDAFGIARLTSTLYTGDWVGPLHSHLMHAQDRSKPRKLTSFDGATKKDLNQMPVDFAKEIVRLWRDFGSALARANDPNIQALQPIAADILRDAISNAARVADNSMVTKYGVSPIRW